MGAGQVRSSKALIELVGREKLGPVVAKAKAQLASFAAAAKRYGGAAIGSPVPAAAAQAAARTASAAAKAQGAAAAPQAAAANKVSRAAIQAVPAAMQELTASLKATGQAGAVVNGSLRTAADTMSKVSGESLRMVHSIAELVPALRDMNSHIRSMGRLARQASGAGPQPKTPTYRKPGVASTVAAVGGALGAGVSGLALAGAASARASAVQLGKAWQVAGAELRALGAGAGAVGNGLSRLGGFTRALAGDVARLGVGLKFAGLAATGFLAVAARTFVKVGSDAYDMSQRLGISTEAWSELGFAAEQAGASTESLEASLRKMQDTLFQAAAGSEAANQTLASMGLRIEDLVGLKPEAQLERIADGIASIADPAARTALGLDVFGRNAGKLLPILISGAAGIRSMRDEARRLGITISTADAATADRLGDAFGSLGAIGKKAFFAIGAAMEPLLSRGVAIASVAVSGATEWVKSNGALVLSFGAIAVGAVAVGGAVLALAPVLAAVGSGVVALGTVATIGGAALTALASPIGLATAALAAATAGTLALSGNLRGLASTVAGRVVASFSAMRTTATETVEGIVAALESGDTKRATEILWQGVRLATEQGVDAIRGAWDGILDELPTSWDQMVNRMASALTVIETEVTNLFDRLSTPISEGIVGGLQEYTPGFVQSAVLGVDISKATQADLETAFTAGRKETEARVERRRREMEAILDAQRQEYDRQKAPERARRQAESASRAARIAELEAELEKNVREARDANERRKAIESDRPKEPKVDAAVRRLTQANAAAAERAEASSIVTFAGSRAGGLGSGTVERMTRHAERTAKNTEALADILRVVQGLDLSFGEG